MTLITCKHCGETLVEADYDAHQGTHHPTYTIRLIEILESVDAKLERIASALEGLERRS
jgi:transcription initiation factor IIE alpha subunit